MNDCPFCRAPYITLNDADALAMIQARARKKHPTAIRYLAGKYAHGGLGLQKDTRKAVVLYAEAAELDSVEALLNLGIAYYHGKSVQVDKEKGVLLWTKAAMQGHVESRYNLGCDELRKKNYDLRPCIETPPDLSENGGQVFG